MASNNLRKREDFGVPRGFAPTRELTPKTLGLNCVERLYRWRFRQHIGPIIRKRSP